MKLNRIITILLLVITLLFNSACIDLGEGEDENSFQQYFSKVYFISREGVAGYDMSIFSASINLEDTDIGQVVEQDEYCYICFKTAYELRIDEFAFHFVGNENTSMYLDFFISEKMPTKIENGKDVTYLPKEEDITNESSNEILEKDDEGNIVEREDEVSEDILTEEKKYFSTIVEVSNKWNSVLLDFEEVKTIEKGSYIIIRIPNNCYTKSDIEFEKVRFSLNYLLFHFVSVKK